MAIAQELVADEVKIGEETRNEQELQDSTSLHTSGEVFIEEVDTYNMMFIQSTSDC